MGFFCCCGPPDPCEDCGCVDEEELPVDPPTQYQVSVIDDIFITGVGATSCGSTCNDGIDAVILLDRDDEATQLNDTEGQIGNCCKWTCEPMELLCDKEEGTDTTAYARFQLERVCTELDGTFQFLYLIVGSTPSANDDVWVYQFPGSPAAKDCEDWIAVANTELTEYVDPVITDCASHVKTDAAAANTIELSAL